MVNPVKETRWCLTCKKPFTFEYKSRRYSTQFFREQYCEAHRSTFPVQENQDGKYSRNKLNTSQGNDYVQKIVNNSISGHMGSPFTKGGRGQPKCDHFEDKEVGFVTYSTKKFGEFDYNQIHRCSIAKLCDKFPMFSKIRDKLETIVTKNVLGSAHFSFEPDDVETFVKWLFCSDENINFIELIDEKQKQYFKLEMDRFLSSVLVDSKLKGIRVGSSGSTIKVGSFLTMQRKGGTKTDKHCNDIQFKFQFRKFLQEGNMIESSSESHQLFEKLFTSN